MELNAGFFDADFVDGEDAGVEELASFAGLDQQRDAVDPAFFHEARVFDDVQQQE